MTFFRGWTLVLVPVWGCAQAAPHTSIAQPPAPVVLPSPAPEAAAPATGCRAAPVDAQQCLDYTASMALGRALVQAHDLECATKVLDALVDDRPGDPRALYERAHVRRLAGSDDLADFDMALGLIAPDKFDRELAASIWIDKAEVFRKKGASEPSRIAFAIAEHLGSKAATEELKDASRCTATWEGRPQGQGPVQVARAHSSPTSESGPIATSWHELAVARFQWGKCDGAEPPKGEAASRKYACRGCLEPGAAQMDDPTDECTTTTFVGGQVVHQPASDKKKRLDPWTLDDCLGFGGPWDSFTVEPLGEASFYYEPHLEESPADVRSILRHRFERGLLVLETTDARSVDVPGSDAYAERAHSEWFSIPEESPSPCASGRDLKFFPRSGACIHNAVGPGLEAGMVALVTPFAPRRVDYYDLATGNPRFQITVWDAEPEGAARTDEVHVVIAGSTATVSGGGCSAVVPLGDRKRAAR